ncbi:hypothetical protein [Aquimarina aquimarini]|uniref:hypothetical protein n=1 Tax=Aquimarina aquimarini TaxID=1191734 RepID=UPI000D55B0DB|nr:hypothetical protein [Aquimarina aquimarini]
MKTLKFENLPNVVTKYQKGQSELKVLLLQKANPQPETDNPITIQGVSKLFDATIIVVLFLRKKSLLTPYLINLFKILKFIYQLFKTLDYLRLFFESTGIL